MSLGTFLPRTQRLKALPKNKINSTNVYFFLFSPKQLTRLDGLSPLRSPGTSSLPSYGGWPGLDDIAHPGKTTPGRKSGRPGHLKLCL